MNGKGFDARTWPEWSPIDALDPVRSSGLDPDGRDPVGAVRAFRTGRTVSGERIVGLDEGRRLSYEDAFNPVLRDYRAEVELRPDPAGGTVVHWRGSYRGRRGMGPFLQGYLRRFMQEMVDGLAARAGTPR